MTQPSNPCFVSKYLGVLCFQRAFQKINNKSHGAVSSSCHHFFPYFYHVDLGDNIQPLFNGEVTSKSFSLLSRCESVRLGTINIEIARRGRSTAEKFRPTSAPLQNMLLLQPFVWYFKSSTSQGFGFVLPYEVVLKSSLSWGQASPCHL